MEGRIIESWDGLLAKLPPDRSDIYLTEAYHRLHETERDKAECFLYEDGSNIYIFPYLKRENQVGNESFFDFESAYGYGGPVSNTQDATFLAAAESAAFTTFRQLGFIAGFVRFCPWLDNVKLITDSSRVLMDRKTVLMDLTPCEEQIWKKQIHAKNRNMIRKGERAGLAFEVDLSLSHLDQFLHIYAETMHRLKASNFYLFSDSYFQRLKETLTGHAFLGLIYDKKTIIAATIFLRQGHCAHYHLSGSLSAYQELAPNNLLLYRSAIYVKQNGASFLHLGGGSSHHTENTLFKFKKRFSTNTRDFYIGKFVFNQERYDKVCRIWSEKSPDKEQTYGHMLLKYRI